MGQDLDDWISAYRSTDYRLVYLNEQLEPIAKEVEAFTLSPYEEIVFIGNKYKHLNYLDNDDMLEMLAGNFEAIDTLISGLEIDLRDLGIILRFILNRSESFYNSIGIGQVTFTDIPTAKQILEATLIQYLGQDEIDIDGLLESDKYPYTFLSTIKNLNLERGLRLTINDFRGCREIESAAACLTKLKDVYSGFRAMI